MNNIAYNIGDVLYVRPALPVLNATAFTGYSDVVVGETLTRYFEREFRVATDGLNFSQWSTLSAQNLSNISVSESDWPIFEFRYTRAGSDATGQLELTSVTVSATASIYEAGPTYESTAMFELLGAIDEDTELWSQNVTEKCYGRGIIPSFISRGSSPSDDADYIALWRATCMFFSNHVAMARKFQNFPYEKILLSTYLQHRGLFLSGDEDLGELADLMMKFYQEVRSRGTQLIYKKAGEMGRYQNGELLRLFAFRERDEFIFDVVETGRCGLFVDRSSPEHKTMTPQIAVNKAYEDSQDFVDLSVYPLIVSDPPNCHIATVAGKEVLEILKAGRGIGGVHPENAITVDKGVDYEITFWWRDDTQADNLKFGVLPFDEAGNQLTCMRMTTGAPTNNFFTKRSLPRDDEFFFVRGILFNMNAEVTMAKDRQLNVGFGTHLLMPKNIATFIPVIEQSPIDGVHWIWDLKVRPLCSGKHIDPLYYTAGGSISYTPNTNVAEVKGAFGTCFVQAQNMTLTWAKNRSGRSQLSVEDAMRRFLLPYNTNIKNIYL